MFSDNFTTSFFVFKESNHYSHILTMASHGLPLKTIHGDGPFPEILFLHVLAFAFTQFTGEIYMTEFSAGITLVLLPIWYSPLFFDYNVK